MTEENVNSSEETAGRDRGRARRRPAAETTDAPDGVADVENVPEEAAPAEADEPWRQGRTRPRPSLRPPSPRTCPTRWATSLLLRKRQRWSKRRLLRKQPRRSRRKPLPRRRLRRVKARSPLSLKRPRRLPPSPSPRRRRSGFRARCAASGRRRSAKRTAERKPITRLPKPEHARGRRQERQGKVVSAASDKTIVVRVDTVKVHPMYKKVIRRSTKLHAHDAENQAKIGDVVRIVETRPISKQKRWRLQEIVEAAK